MKQPNQSFDERNLNDTCFIPHFSHINKDLEALHIFFLLFMILKYKYYTNFFFENEYKIYSGESNFFRNDVSALLYMSLTYEKP